MLTAYFPLLGWLFSITDTSCAALQPTELLDAHTVVSASRKVKKNTNRLIQV